MVLRKVPATPAPDVSLHSEWDRIRWHRANSAGFKQSVDPLMLEESVDAMLGKGFFCLVFFSV